MNKISKNLVSHYSSTFKKHGCSPRGVDWRDKNTAELRYQKMLELMSKDHNPTVLDVGCGYGGFLDYTKSKNLKLSYSGIDPVEDMIAMCSHKFPDSKFWCESLEDFKGEVQFDYVVCNGIFTQKLDASILEMDAYMKKMLHKMFSLCKKGIAFNIMSTYANFYTSNLYYKNPLEILAFCLSEITRNIRLDHSYGMYEYTVYLYRE